MMGDAKPERNVTFTFAGSATLGFCIAAGLSSVGYFGSQATMYWAFSQEKRAAADTEIAKQQTEQAKFNCMQWPLAAEVPSGDFKVDESPKGKKGKK